MSIAWDRALVRLLGITVIPTSILKLWLMPSFALAKKAGTLSLKFDASRLSSTSSSTMVVWLGCLLKQQLEAERLAL